MKLIIIRGLPGSGKSTLACNLKSEKILHFETDMFWTDENGEYHFDYNLLSEAHYWCFERVLDTIEKGLSCIVSNTFTTMEEMESYIELGKDLDAEIIIINCRDDFGSTKGVPFDKLEKMRERWEEVDHLSNDCLIIESEEVEEIIIE